MYVPAVEKKQQDLPLFSYEKYQLFMILQHYHRQICNVRLTSLQGQWIVDLISHEQSTSKCEQEHKLAHHRKNKGFSNTEQNLYQKISITVTLYTHQC